MMSEAIRALVLVASSLSGYKAPDAELQVVEVSPVVMQGLACRGRQNCPVMALYQDHDVVFIRADLIDTAKEHILFHEIVHWLQHHSGKYGEHPVETCLMVVEREREAYHLQNRYIAEVQHGFSFNHAPFATCPDESK